MNLHDRKLYTICFNALFIGVLLATLLLSSCDNKSNGSIDKIHIGILPDQTPKNLWVRYSPLFKYISDEIGIPVYITIPKSYDELLELFNRGEVDLAYFGGAIFISAYLDSRAVPLVMREVDTHFTSYFIVKGDSPVKKVTELKGKTIAFGAKLSTSGHFIPRYYLGKMGIEIPEEYFSRISYSGSHDTTAYWVRDNIVELGLVNSLIVQQMLADGRLKKPDIRVLWETPPYADYVWAIQDKIDTKLRNRIRDVFTSLSVENEDHKKILDNLGTTHFIPANMDNFTALKVVISKARHMD